MSDLISRAAAIDALDNQIEQCDKALGSFDISMKDEYAVKVERASLIAYKEQLEYLPPAQPEQRWISCEEQLPKNRDWVLGIFQEGSAGWINPIPFICDYVGKKTPITTQDNWLLKMVDEPHPYYKELHCIAWMPLPEPYKEEGDS